MNKFFIIFFLLLGISGCITTHEKSVSYKTKTNLDLSRNKIKDDVIELEISNNVCIKVRKNSITTVLPKGSI